MATLTVTTLDDETFDGGDFATEQTDGNGLSLREALALSQDGDTISFDDALSGGTITLVNGQLEITQDDLTIDGDLDDDDAADIFIDANGQSRVLQIASGSDVDPNDVEIDGLVITGGYNNLDGNVGGGVLIFGNTNVIFRNSKITNNEAAGSGADGGGIAALGDNIHLGIYDSTISENSANGDGGGVFVNSNNAVVNISGTEISSNSAYNGGGLNANGAGVVVNISGESYIAHNQADYGGGVRTLNSDLTISEGTKFTSNYSERSGGAIEIRGDATILDTTFVDNFSLVGGAVYLMAPNHSVEIANSAFIGNSALSGAAVKAAAGDGLSVANSVFYGNFVTHGGVVDTDEVPLVIGSSTFTGNLAGLGSIVSYGDRTYVANSIFVGNESPSSSFYNAGGGLFESYRGNIFSEALLAHLGDFVSTDVAEVFSEVVINPYTGVLSGRLRDNGGPVKSVMINPDGLAHDGGFSGSQFADLFDLDRDMNTAEDLPFDARGVQRVANEAVDIGAVELVITDGTDSDNVIDGDEYSEVVNGHGGDDSLKGMDGHDSLHGDAGKDLIYGNNGDDYIRGGTENDDLRGSNGDDTVYGDKGRDYLRGNSGDDDLRGSTGGDTLDGGLDNDQLRGASGNDTLNGRVGNDYLSGGIGNDRLNAHEGVDTLIGGDGDDTLYGNPGDDSLSGGNADDDLRGGNDNDTLAGEDGNDTLRGNSGDDQFNFALGDDADEILGFVAGAGSDDVIALSGFGTDFDTFAEVLAAASDDGNGNTVIDFGNGDSITLIGVDVGSLHDDDFVFV